MKKEYNKLVRDRIPEIIAAEGHQYATEIMSETEYRDALLTKIREEAEEVQTASPDNLIIELADVLEVIDAIMEFHNLQPADVKQIQQARREERGAFKQRIKLLWTE